MIRQSDRIVLQFCVAGIFSIAVACAIREPISLVIMCAVFTGCVFLITLTIR